MAHETLTCAEDIALDRLSALRDEALPARETDRLRAHIAECAACRARLADFDTLAGALHAQRELDPGDRVLDGVHVRLAGQSRPARSWRGGRGVWARLAALAPVAALILLFVYVFAGAARHPIAHTTPTAQNASGSNTPVTQGPNGPTPMPAPFHIPAYTPDVSAEIAWGGLKPAKSITFTLQGARQFLTEAYSPDLTEIGGIIFNNSPTGPDAYLAQLAYYAVASDVITPLNVTWRGRAGDPMGYVSMMDNRFIVYDLDQTRPRSTWSFDRETGQTWRIMPPNYTGGVGYGESDGRFVVSANDGRVWATDLATHTMTLIVAAGATPGASASSAGFSDFVGGFQWPYLISGETPANTPSAQATTFTIVNLETGVKANFSATLPDPNANATTGQVTIAPSSLLLSGNTLYVTTDTAISDNNTIKPVYGSLYRMENVFTPGSQFTMLARWPESFSIPGFWRDPNARVIPLGSGYFWDLTEQRLVTTSLGWTRTASYYIVATPVPKSYETHSGGQPMDTYTLTLYDTSTFAIR